MAANGRGFWVIASFNFVCKLSILYTSSFERWCIQYRRVPQNSGFPFRCSPKKLTSTIVGMSSCGYLLGYGKSLKGMTQPV